MVRLRTISWRIGLAVLAAALPYRHLPVLAADGQAEKVEPPPQPIEVRSVPVILLPPANEALFAFKPARPAKEGIVISVPPTDDAAVTPPSPEPATVKEDAASLVAPSRPEPAKVQEDAPAVEHSSLPQRPSQTALQLPASSASSARPRPEPVKVKKDATFTAIPSLPERRPFRPVLANIEPQEKAQNAASVSSQAREPTSFIAKVNAAFQPLADLWPGNRQAANAVSPVAESKSDGTASPASGGPGPASENTDGKQESGSFLKKLRFW